LQPPMTRYAPAGDTQIAWQMLGEGPDVVYLPANSSHIDLLWDHPAMAAFMSRLASFSRLMLFDRRGQGMSDPASGPSVASLEEWIDDTLAVMDAAGTERATLVGFDVSGPMALLLAATHPDRVRSLVLINTLARARRAPDYPYGWTDRECNDIQAFVGSSWGTGAGFASLDATIARSEAEQNWWARWERSATHPAGAVASTKMMHDIDVRPVITSVRQPVLILHSRRNGYIEIGHGRWLAENLPDAHLVELEGSEHLGVIFGAMDVALGEMEQFITGHRRSHSARRVLSTVLFTDIVESTKRIAASGDEAWARLLARHDELVRKVVAGHQGVTVKSTGDGILATFDSPARATRAACEVIDRVRILGLDVRAGLHTGEVELLDDDVAGLAVHLSARIAALAGPGEVLVSRTVKDLVAGSGLGFEQRGEHELRGVPDRWTVYAAQPGSG
jgi:class 3 adenylate cyclase/pimeloyl-ACP methyl ester carboxylesterase